MRRGQNLEARRRIPVPRTVVQLERVVFSPKRLGQLRGKTNVNMYPGSALSADDILDIEQTLIPQAA